MIKTYKNGNMDNLGTKTPQQQKCHCILFGLNDDDDDDYSLNLWKHGLPPWISAGCQAQECGDLNASHARTSLHCEEVRTKFGNKATPSPPHSSNCPCQQSFLPDVSKNVCTAVQLLQKLKNQRAEGAMVHIDDTFLVFPLLQSLMVLTSFQEGHLAIGRCVRMEYTYIRRMRPPFSSKNQLL